MKTFTKLPIGLISLILTMSSLATAEMMVQSDEMINQSFNVPAEVPYMTSEHGKMVLMKNESTVSNEEGGLSLYIKDTSAEGNPYAEWELDAVPNKPVEISFDYYLDGLAGSIHAVQVRGPEGQGIMLALSLWDNSGAAYHDGKSPQKLGKIFSKEKWYRVTLTLPPRKSEGKTFSMAVMDSNGEQIFAEDGLKFKKDISDYSSLRFFFNTGPKPRGSSFLIDNLVVKVVSE